MLDKIIHNMERYAGLLLAGFLAFVGAAYVGSLIEDAGSSAPVLWVLTIWAMIIVGAIVVILTVLDVLLSANSNNTLSKGVQTLRTNQELLAASSFAFIAAATIGNLTVDAGSSTPAVWLVYIWGLMFLGWLILVGVLVDSTVDNLATNFIGASIKRLRENQRLLMTGFVGAVAPAYIGSWTVDAGSSTPAVWLAAMWVSLAVSAVILLGAIIVAAVEGSENTLLGKLMATLRANRRVALGSFLGFAGAAFIGSLTVDAGTEIPAVWLAAMWIMLAAGAIGIIAVVVQTALVASGQGQVPERESSTDPVSKPVSHKKKAR